MVIDQWLMLINHCSPTHLLDHIRFTAVMGDWYDSVSAVSRDTGGIIRVTQSRSPGHLRTSSLIHRPALCCRFRCCWSHCLMNLRSPRTNWITLLHWMHRATQSAPTLCPTLLPAAKDPRESSWHAKQQRLARTLQASVLARTRPRSRNSAQRLLEIAMHVIVTDQHCQRQASSCIDASLHSHLQN